MRAKEVIEKLKRKEEVSMQNLFGLINQYPLTTLMVEDTADSTIFSLEINNVDDSTFVSVTAMENGFAIGKKYDFYKYCIMDLNTKELPVMVELLDSLIEGEEESK